MNCGAGIGSLQNKDTVYLLDYSGPPGFASQIAKLAAKCIVLDHHKTAAEHLTGPDIILPPNLEVHLDMERSGAIIALDYFKPAGLTAENIAFFKHIEDGDLWKWKIPGSREFYAGLTAAKLDFDVRSNPTIFDQLLSTSPSTLINVGKIELQRQDKLVAAAVEQAYVIDIGGEAGRAAQWGQGLAVEIEGELINLRSSLGNQLAEAAEKKELRPVGAVVYREAGMETSEGTKEDIKVSLRSKGDEDTTVVSQAFGGGGHRNASSFLINKTEFDSWKVST